MIDPDVVLDFLTVKPLDGRLDLEFENFAIAVTSGDAHRSYVEGNASAGGATGLEANTNRRFRDLRNSALETRSYEMTIRVKRNDNRGRVEDAIADDANERYVNIGPELDLFGPAGSVALPPVFITFTTLGTKNFRFKVTGKNSANKTADY